MHKFVHAWEQNRLNTNAQWQYNDVVLKLLIDVTTNDQFNSNYKLRLMSHLMTNFDIFFQKRDWTRDATKDKFALINKVENFLYAIERWFEIYEIQTFFVKKIEKILNKKHSNTLTSMNNLTLMLKSQSNYDEIEQIHRQTLTLRKTMLRKNHFSTLTSVYCLVYLLHQRNHYKNAKSFYHRACIEYKKTLEKNHSIIATYSRHYASMFEQKSWWDWENFKSKETYLRKSWDSNTQVATTLSINFIFQM